MAAGDESSGVIQVKQPFIRQVLLPVGAALLVGALLYWLNSLALPTSNRELYRFTKNSLLILFYAWLWLSGPLFVYPYLYFHGAGLRERTVGAFVLPVAYILSEIIRVSEYFSWGEALYYGLSTMGLLTLALQAGLLGAAEMFCRWRQRTRTGQPRRVVSWGPVGALLFMFGAVYVLLLWGMGVYWFYIYQEGYKVLFFR